MSTSNPSRRSYLSGGNETSVTSKKANPTSGQRGERCRQLRLGTHHVLDARVPEMGLKPGVVVIRPSRSNRKGLRFQVVELDVREVPVPPPGGECAQAEVRVLVAALDVG